MEAVADEIKERKRLNNLMLVASAVGYIADVKTLMQRGAEVNVRDKRNLTALHFAAGRGWLDVVQLLWSKAADLDAESSLGLTPLHLAALNGREDVVRFLVSKSALINVEDAEENIPLHSAARGGHLGVVTLLLDAATASGGAVSTSIKAKNKLGLTPGACALLHGHIDIANKLVAQGWDPYQPGPDKFSVLHLAAAVGRSDAVSWLLENGNGNVDDAENVDKKTPLHCAAVSGDVDTCQVLLDARADVDAVDGKNQRPLDLIPAPSSEIDSTCAVLPVEVVGKLKDLLKPSIAAGSSAKKLSIAISTTSTTSSTTNEIPSSGHAAFLCLSPADQIRRARKWASLHPTELEETLESYPGAEEAIRRLKMAAELRRTVEIMKAMASLRCDEEFQKDISQPSVHKAVMKLRKNPSLYESLAQDLKIKSVVAKMGRIHAVVQANGQRTFSIEELIVPFEEIKSHERKDKEMIDGAMHAMECQLAGAAAAAAALNKKKAVELAEKAVSKRRTGQWKESAVAEKIEEIEEVVEDTRERRRETAKENVWKQAERETSIFDQAIADAIEGEEVEREQRNWRVLVFLAVVLMVWIFSLMHRWGMFTPGEPKVVLQSLEIEIDGVKVEL
ncbi:hypothetical protein Ndes2526A_g08704 [Nannochloris sp. 'desiccata']